MIRKILLVLMFMMLNASAANSYMKYTLSDSSAILPANSVLDIRSDGSAIWIASSGGVAKTTDGGENWIRFGIDDGLKSNSVSGLAAMPGLVWAATSRSEVQEGELIPVGTGLATTKDGGAAWGIYEPNQAAYYGKIAYDLEITDSTVWAACFYGGLIRTFGNDSSFYNVFPDSATRAQFDSAGAANPNSGGFAPTLQGRFFSVKADTSHPDSTIIYGGGAAGIYRFVFTSYDTLPDTVYHAYYADTLLTSDQWLPGNFVISMGVQYLDSTSVLWAGCKPAGGGYIAISRSIDNGLTWQTSDPSYDLECWNFAFDGNTVYTATTQGLLRSEDNGQTWTNLRPSGGYVDDSNHTAYLAETFYSVAIVGNTLWAGGPDGVIRSSDNGVTWRVFRSYIPASQGADFADAGDSYAYPVPFSPERGTGYVRFHYRAPSTTKATIKVYDFGLNLVRTVIDGKQVIGGQEYDDDIWEGQNGEGDVAVNGVYFYLIKFDNGTDWWGKLAVLK
ncbi:MAG: hypothetical protein CO189_08080 [candidate division Zixibacteria bacterium CG_4_9_14_3_um_filter_46_8]|nr:MAG: hypothetical protein CO189_08080 [candidate division Zixibacteria bacterium CG_4_9_14_3_um_filter_46_8]